MRFAIMLAGIFTAYWLPAIHAETPNWPQFRGLNASGTVAQANPPTDIGPQKNVRWKVAVPSGMSSPVIWGEQIFLTAYDKDQLFTICYNRTNGQEQWRQPAPAKAIEDFHKTEGSPAASSCATDGKVVVSYFGSCGLFCYDLNGKLLWQQDYPAAETLGRFGTGTSPILVDGLVILARDEVKSPKVFAYQASDGKLVWEHTRPDSPTAYSTPVIWDNKGVREVVLAGVGKLSAYAVKTGEPRWTVQGIAAVVCTTPIISNEMLIYAGWSPGSAEDTAQAMPNYDALLQSDKNKDGQLSREEVAGTMMASFFDSNDTDRDGQVEREEWDGMLNFMKSGKNVVLAVKAGGTGDITKTHVSWRQTKNLPYVPSPVAVGKQLFVIKDGGIACTYDIQSGEIGIKPERVGANGSYYASPIAVGNRVYVSSLDGVMTVLSVGEKFEQLSRNDFGERISATPAVIGDTIYVRTATQLYAFAK